jgi:hypothetical protein
VDVHVVWHPNRPLGTQQSPPFHVSGSGASPPRLYFDDGFAPQANIHIDTHSVSYTCDISSAADSGDHNPVYGDCDAMSVTDSGIHVYGWVNVYDGGLFSPHSGQATVTISCRYIPNSQVPGTD